MIFNESWPRLVGASLLVMNLALGGCSLMPTSEQNPAQETAEDIEQRRQF